ncbi:UDP-glucuronosyltransferase 2C1-like [Contarinia nasturtii]|uniref:UDP-glucuronosyltransferase 2C1-like n=1 Tax=Contarinia nasturtii TaxID=265458 RepID=UPI0012D379D6|nr:UDP-glucuronosyltransferase 2C1-like [Contarinia nasturtii]
MSIRLVFFIVCNILFVNGSNILILATLPSPSHHIWIGAVTSELAGHGHNITVISPDIDKNPPPGIHYILIENQYTDVNRQFLKEMLSAPGATSLIQDALAMFKVRTDICEAQVQTNGFKTLLNYPDNFKFDLIIHDYTCGPCHLPFAHKFKNPPLLGVTGYSNPSFMPLMMGGHQYTAYIPHNALLSDKNMNFLERLTNFPIYGLENVYRQQFFIPAIDTIVQKSFGTNIPSVSELEKRTALAFVNTNPAMDYPAPLSENIIPVAGLHIKDPKPIPSDLKAFVDSSNKGIVIFSLGTNFRSDFLPEAKQKLFLEVFRQFPDYHFLWKFESNLPASNLPKNVLIRPWLPISNILADSKTKAIFFHGGLLTTQEAIWRGVPMIIMPLGFDQKQNLMKTKRLGISEGVDYFSLSKAELKKTLHKVLEDPLYSINALKWSAKFRDQKEKPLDRAVWWIEWLLRNPDCDHLKSPVLQLGFIVGNSYDIIAFIILLVTVILIISLKIFGHCIRKCSRNIYSKETMPHKKFE